MCWSFSRQKKRHDDCPVKPRTPALLRVLSFGIPPSLINHLFTTQTTGSRTSKTHHVRVQRRRHAAGQGPRAGEHKGRERDSRGRHQRRPLPPVLLGPRRQRELPGDERGGQEGHSLRRPAAGESSPPRVLADLVVALSVFLWVGVATVR